MSMCGAYGFSIKDAKEVYDRFGVMNKLALPTRYNVRPGQMNPVIAGNNEISFMFWGLIPFWSKDQKMKFSTINARCETVAASPAYRKPFRTQRCLIPATGFYEPDKIHYDKPPFPWHYFTLKDQPLFAFAGLYDIWRDRQSGEEVYSYTIITTEPNEIVGKFHNRMPVILHREDEETWINPDINEPERIQPLLVPYPSHDMEEWLVSDAARNPKNDTPSVMKPV